MDYIINDNGDGSGELVPIVDNVLDSDNKIDIPAGFTMSDYDSIAITGETVGFFTVNTSFDGTSNLTTGAGGEFVLVDDPAIGASYLEQRDGCIFSW